MVVEPKATYALTEMDEKHNGDKIKRMLKRIEINFFTMLTRPD